MSFEDLMSLLNDVHKTNSGPIEKALRDADIARIGQARDSPFGFGVPIQFHPEIKMGTRIPSRTSFKYQYRFYE